MTLRSLLLVGLLAAPSFAADQPVRPVLESFATLHQVEGLARRDREATDGDLFTGAPEYVPYLLCEYTDVPVEDEDPPNYNQRLTLVRGVLGIARHAEYGFNTKRTEWVVDERLDDEGNTVYKETRVYPQYVYYDVEKDKATRLDLEEKAPAFSLIGERATRVKISKQDWTGTVRMRFWHGGWFGSRPYSDETHPISCELVDQ
jgi:hypothetical protein